MPMMRGAIVAALLVGSVAQPQDLPHVSVQVTQAHARVLGTGFEPDRWIRVVLMEVESGAEDDCFVDTSGETDKRGRLCVPIEIPPKCCNGRRKLVAKATPAATTDLILQYDSAEFRCVRG
jgi:hypothetical protein